MFKKYNHARTDCQSTPAVSRRIEVEVVIAMHMSLPVKLFCDNGFEKSANRGGGSGVNRVILIGRLGGDPEMRYTADGTAVCKFSLATSRKYTGRDGQKQEKTEWHRVVVWRKLAEICGQYLGKGKQVMIEGRIEYGSYEKDGVKHYTTDIVADNMEMLGAAGNQGQERDAGAPFPPEGGAPPEDDIPF
jgi:single-strand DNA-binding protein